MDNPLNTELFPWKDGDGSYRISESLKSVGIFGETGAGKSTSSAALLIKHYLRNNYGMLVLSAKPELEQWKRYCKAYQREEDLIVFGPDSGHYLNFLEYEMDRKDSGQGIAHNIANTILTTIKSGYEDKGGDNKAFWDSSLQKLLVNSIELMLISGNKKFKHLYEIIISAPKSRAHLQNPDWVASSKCMRLLKNTRERLMQLPKSKENDAIANALELAIDFFTIEWVDLADKTRSIVQQYFSAFADRFMRPPLSTLFQDNETTITPEDCLENGKIIILDLPYLTYERTGQDAQILWKHLWMRAAQRRVIQKLSRPCCLFTDECQYFLTDYDAMFQSTCRAYRACSVYITQNLPNFYLNAGMGESGRLRFRALAGNLSTKIFHANSDPETNEYAADLFGKGWRWSQSEGQSFGENFSFNQGESQVWEHKVPPSEFSKLRTGGEENGFLSEAYVHRQGKVFPSTGENYKKEPFKQILL